MKEAQHFYPRLSSSDWESTRLKIWLSPVQIRAEASGQRVTKPSPHIYSLYA